MTKERPIIMSDDSVRAILNGRKTQHNGQCEYRHYPCAVLKLCDEIDALRAELAAAQAEIEQLKTRYETVYTHLNNVLEEIGDEG